MDEQQFQRALKENGITLSQNQLHQFDNYYRTLVNWNEKINLTAITDKRSVYEKHFYDSLTPAFHFDLAEINSLCDVGAGAGFPSIPLKICFPHLHVTIVDSRKKRIIFLEQLISDLGLCNVNLYHDRAETFAHRSDVRESFDFVIARAVANLATLCELCLPLVKMNGFFLAMKGSEIDDECRDAQRALKILGGELTSISSTMLPVEKSKRHLLFVKKIKQTPKKYPRKPGIPSKMPL